MRFRAATALALSLGFLTVLSGGAWLVLRSWDVEAKRWRRSSPDPAIPGACRGNADCPPGQACLLLPSQQHFECLPPECSEDADCKSGFICRMLESRRAEPGVRRCVRSGILGEGERCLVQPGSPEEGCGPGLICGFDVCGRPCQPGEQGSCPKGQVCRQGPRGASCLPDCGQVGCPDGMTCVRIRSPGYAMCYRIVGENCIDQPCPEGQDCAHRFPRLGSMLRTWCVDRCDGDEDCKPGSFCSGMHCVRVCTPGADPQCGPEMRCNTYKPDRRVYVCGWPPLPEEGIPLDR